MNIAAAIEESVRDALAASAALPDGARAIAWQSPAGTASWSPDDDRVFPLLDIRCSPPGAEEDDQTALYCDVQISALSKVALDRDRASVAALYAVAEALVLSLCCARYAGHTAAWDAFCTALACRAPRLLPGGATLLEGSAPTESSSLYSIGTACRIHFTYSSSAPETPTEGISNT